MSNEENTEAATMESVLQRENLRTIRVYFAVGLRGGKRMTSAGFNRRMRKTACPGGVEGTRGEIPVSPSDQ